MKKLLGLRKEKVREVTLFSLSSGTSSMSSDYAVKRNFQSKSNDEKLFQSFGTPDKTKTRNFCHKNYLLFVSLGKKLSFQIYVSCLILSELFNIFCILQNIFHIVNDINCFTLYFLIYFSDILKTKTSLGLTLLKTKRVDSLVVLPHRNSDIHATSIERLVEKKYHQFSQVSLPSKNWYFDRKNVKTLKTCALNTLLCLVVGSCNNRGGYVKFA